MQNRIPHTSQKSIAAEEEGFKNRSVLPALLICAQMRTSGTF